MVGRVNAEMAEIDEGTVGCASSANLQLESEAREQGFGAVLNVDLIYAIRIHRDGICHLRRIDDGGIIKPGSMILFQAHLECFDGLLLSCDDALFSSAGNRRDEDGNQYDNDPQDNRQLGQSERAVVMDGAMDGW